MKDVGQVTSWCLLTCQRRLTRFSLCLGRMKSQSLPPTARVCVRLQATRTKCALAIQQQLAPFTVSSTTFLKFNVRFTKTRHVRHVSKQFNFIDFNTGCYGTMNSETRVLTPPGHPQQYSPRSHTCQWVISEPAGSKINMEFPTGIDIYSGDGLYVSVSINHFKIKIHEFRQTELVDTALIDTSALRRTHTEFSAPLQTDRNRQSNADHLFNEWNHNTFFYFLLGG